MHLSIPQAALQLRGGLLGALCTWHFGTFHLGTGVQNIVKNDVKAVGQTHSLLSHGGLKMQFKQWIVEY